MYGNIVWLVLAPSVPNRKCVFTTENRPTDVEILSVTTNLNRMLAQLWTLKSPSAFTRVIRYWLFTVNVDEYSELWSIRELTYQVAWCSYVKISSSCDLRRLDVVRDTTGINRWRIGFSATGEIPSLRCKTLINRWFADDRGRDFFQK